MNDSSTTIAADGSAQSVNEFLGVAERPRWRRWAKFWIPGLLVLLVGLYFVNRGEGDKPQYITEAVTERSLDIEVTATGNLRPTNQVDVGSEVSGRIDRVLVDVNDRVVRGQVLAQINTDVIDDQIKQGRANLDAARAQVAQARATPTGDFAQACVDAVLAPRPSPVIRIGAGSGLLPGIASLPIAVKDRILIRVFGLAKRDPAGP